MELAIQYYPLQFCIEFFTTWPLLLIIALIPLFADLIKNVFCSMALKLLWKNVDTALIEFPNQPSSEILTIKFVSLLELWTNP